MNTGKLCLVFAVAVMAAFESRSAAAVDGISFEGLSPIDAAAFSVERADKDGDRIYQFAEKSGTHAREIVVVPGNGLKAENAQVLRSILLSRSRSICSARSNGRLGGLPLGRPVARCFMLYSPCRRRA